MGLSTADDLCSVPEVFPFSIRIGLIFIAQAAGLSAIAIACLLSYIVYSTVKVRKGATRHWTMSTHVHWYFLSLLVSELIQAIGGLLNAQWIKDAAVTEGALCTTQGVLKQLGDVGVALASLVIAIHTFSVIVLGWRPKNNAAFAAIVLSLMWLFMILIVVISLATHKGKDYYGNTQYWCWITSSYPAQRIALEYFWMWTAALINIVLYIPIALVLKGFISASGGRLKVLRRRDSIRAVDISESNQAIDNLATKMLWYPAVYTCTVLPIAIVRWDAFLGHCIPWSATVASDVIFACSGLLNVLLFSVTRPALVPHRTGVNFGMGIRSPTPFSSSPPANISHNTFRSSWSSANQTQRIAPDTVSTSATKTPEETSPGIHVRFPSPLRIGPDEKSLRPEPEESPTS